MSSLTSAAAVPAFAIEKAKTTKDVLDKKALAAAIPAAGIAASVLQFLQAEMQKAFAGIGRASYLGW